jgi:hypothetical protein
MSTVRRDFRASPERTGSETWEAIVALIAPDAKGAARKELSAVHGVAGQLIATEVGKDAAIVVYGSGPRVKIYCLHGDDALTEDEANESSLGFDATSGDWKVSLPAEREDVAWSKAEMAKHSKRISVREKSEAVEESEEEKSATPAATTGGFKVNVKEFLKS